MYDIFSWFLAYETANKILVSSSEYRLTFKKSDSLFVEERLNTIN